MQLHIIVDILLANHKFLLLNAAFSLLNKNTLDKLAKKNIRTLAIVLHILYEPKLNKKFKCEVTESYGSGTKYEHTIITAKNITEENNDKYTPLNPSSFEYKVDKICVDKNTVAKGTFAKVTPWIPNIGPIDAAVILDTTVATQIHTNIPSLSKKYEHITTLE